jgi:hypothetical protein
MAANPSNNSAATEHTEATAITAADSSNNGAATEHTEATAVLYLEHYDVCDRPTQGHRPRQLCDIATEQICIGSCVLHWSSASQLEMGILSHLDYEIQDRIRMPVSLETLLAIDLRLPVVGRRSPSACVEAIARCVAAFQRATDATEHSPCDEMAAKICSYANAIASKMSPYLRDYIMELIHQYIQNRTYDLAVKNVLDGALLKHHRFWSCISDGRQRNECLNIIEICRNTLNDEGQALRDKLWAVRL